MHGDSFTLTLELRTFALSFFVHDCPNVEKGVMVFCSWSLHPSDMGRLAVPTVPMWKSDVSHKLFHISKVYVVIANIKCT